MDSFAGAGHGTTPTPDGRWLLVAMQSISQVAVIDLKAMQVVRTIDLPKPPHEILMAPHGRTAYVSCSASAVVASIRIAEWAITKLIGAGNRVDGLAWASPGQGNNTFGGCHASGNRTPVTDR